MSCLIKRYDLLIFICAYLYFSSSWPLCFIYFFDIVFRPYIYENNQGYSTKISHPFGDYKYTFSLHPYKRHFYDNGAKYFFHNLYSRAKEREKSFEKLVIIAGINLYYNHTTFYKKYSCGNRNSGNA